MSVPGDDSGFQFYSGPVDDLLAQPRGDSYVAFVPTPVPHRTVLFKILQHELRLPEYFGANWDALEECLNDLRWLKGFRVIKLMHAGLPHFKGHKSGKVSPVIYLQVLRDVVKAWAAKPHCRLEVYFPEKDREQISHLLASGEPATDASN